eukprot:TRINITY_DN19644_c0_g1_i1.p1 TRINITY_DN19644_c0_g1~~TRINITY_DN19644_c0_g1_i1.p1  ORF type:complete len:371 (+),score=104.05 TRINITY_DN19644_c0_g1_i1:37-1113(+)
MFKAILCLGLVCVAAGQNAPEYPMPEYVIDLDEAPEHRWDQVISDLKPKISNVMTWLMGMIGPGTDLYPVAEALRLATLKGGSWDLNFLREMDGVARAMNVTVDKVHLANLFYEFGPLACTGIVAQMANGSVIHARNQDFNIPGLPQITIWVIFMKNKQIVYQGTTFASYIGLPTAMRPFGWSVEANTRFTGWAPNVEENIKHAEQGGMTVGYFIRWGVENHATYADAIGIMKNQELISPAYYTMAGTQAWQGAVVTRDRDGPADKESGGQGIWSLNATSNPPAWFRLETNFDHWEPIQDGRRYEGNKHMNEIGQAAINMTGLYAVLSTPPVLATDTIYTAEMFPAAGTYRAVMRRLS